MTTVLTYCAVVSRLNQTRAEIQNVCIAEKVLFTLIYTLKLAGKNCKMY